ncbi:TonB-dependent receptor [Chitinophaga horti]|uniref:TonB-dependent receptor n=1 Tax=Chitinophaga horti TaxID=2920382 RepID=A0ABY6IV45_9BACT|nr:TonB-dependent receptor [Chitinophaga horti]UYQ91238.1 TonB-dependent receptor [Chitinophaga horti]
MKTTTILLFVALLQILSQAVNAQSPSISISGTIKSKKDGVALPYVNVILRKVQDSTFVAGAASNEKGLFTLSGVKPGNYLLEASFMGFKTITQPLFVGTLSPYIDIPPIELEETASQLKGVEVAGQQQSVSLAMDKKTYNLSDNISQGGGSVLQAMQNLPGITIQDGKVQLRGNDKVTVLIDGKQTALTGFGSQYGLDNIPASSIERIEIINNPSSRYDANGNAGIINIIMKKNNQDGWNGKAGIALGAGALWERQANLPGIRPQYRMTPKINPSLSLNYRKNKVNAFLQADNLYTHTLNKNEFVNRIYDNGDVVRQQLKRNRNTNFFNSRAGIDWFINDKNTLTISGMFGSEKIIDRGDQPFFNADLSQRTRLWQFLEDELKTTVMATANYQRKFEQPGHQLNIGFNYTFHREDEKYFYDNTLPASKGTDAFKLLSDEQVYDLNIDYVKPLKYGRIETGIKLRNRSIPTDMNFIPGLNSVLDTTAGGWATYRELIPAVYGNYVFETPKWEAELGLRLEYVRIRYDVNPGHRTYSSDGYHYTQPFPNFRLSYKLNDRNKLSAFFNRRVDRPNEVDIRIFPKYDDADIIKVGNPALRPQFTNSIELGYKNTWSGGSLYAAAYHRYVDGTITRISTVVPGSTSVYAIFQNAGKSYNTGMEMVLEQKVAPFYTFNINGNIYRNRIDAYTVNNLYPVEHQFTAAAQNITSGSVKLNNNLRFRNGLEAQLTAVYMAPDIIPQGTMEARFSLDAGIKKTIQQSKGEIFINATDLLNTMVIKRTIIGNGFTYTSKDYYETQVIRVGYNYKF